MYLNNNRPLKSLFNTVRCVAQYFSFKRLTFAIIAVHSVCTVHLGFCTPFSAEEVQQAIELGKQFTSYDQLQCELKIPDFNFISGSFRPRENLEEENKARFKAVGEAEFEKEAKESTTYHSKLIIQKLLVPPHMIPVMFVYNINIVAQPKGDGGPYSRPSIRYPSHTLRVYYGHDERTLTRDPVGQPYWDSRGTVAQATFSVSSNSHAKHVEIDKLDTDPNFQKGGIAKEMTRKIVSLFKDHQSPNCIVEISARHPASARIATGLDFKVVDKAISSEKQKSLFPDTTHFLEIPPASKASSAQ